jgi:hypothetical protein
MMRAYDPAGHGGQRVLILTLAAALFMVSAAAEDPRYHGVKLDEQHRLVVEQSDAGTCRVGLRMRSRPEGGIDADYTRLEGEAETGRIERIAWLAEVRVQLFKPTMPTYFQSRAEQYHVIVESLMDDVDYVSRRTVPAAGARAYLAAELRKLWVSQEGPRREALYWAVPIVLSALKESGRIPAPVYVVVEESLGGTIRTDPRALTRRSLPAGRDLGPGADRNGRTGLERVRERMTPDTRAGRLGAPDGEGRRDGRPADARIRSTRETGRSGMQREEEFFRP